MSDVNIILTLDVSQRLATYSPSQVCPIMSSMLGHPSFSRNPTNLGITSSHVYKYCSDSVTELLLQCRIQASYLVSLPMELYPVSPFMLSLRSLVVKGHFLEGIWPVGWMDDGSVLCIADCNLSKLSALQNIVSLFPFPYQYLVTYDCKEAPRMAKVTLRLDQEEFFLAFGDKALFGEILDDFSCVRF